MIERNVITSLYLCDSKSKHNKNQDGFFTMKNILKWAQQKQNRKIDGQLFGKCSLTLDPIGDHFWSFQVVQQAFSFLFLTGHPNQEQKGLAQDSFFRFVSIRLVHV